MADVGRDRAQLVLVAALVLAATLVGLALVVNTVIFTENLATRKSVDAGDTVTYHHSAQDGATGALHVANFESDAANYSERSGNFTSYVSGWSNSTTRYSTTTGQSVSVEVRNWSKGTRINQDDSGEFRPAEWGLFADTDILDLHAEVTLTNPHTSWAVASDTTFRQFSMTVNESSLEDSNQTVTEEILNLDDDFERNPFWVQIDNGSETWRVGVYDDEERSGNVSVIVYDGTSSDPADCTAESRDDGTVDIDLTSGTITGADGEVKCDPLSFFTGAGTYDVYYVNGDEVEGTYEFISDKSTDAYGDGLEDLVSALSSTLTVDFDDEVYYDDPADGNPYYTTAIYDTHLQMTYRTDELTYRTKVRLAPGEPGEDDS